MAFVRSICRWLQVAPQNATLQTGQMQAITVQPSLGTLTPGVYQGTLTLQFRDGSAQTVSVLFLIAVVSIVEGMTRYVEDDFAGRILGANTFTLRRYPWFGNNVTEAEWREWQRYFCSYRFAKSPAHQ